MWMCLSMWCKNVQFVAIRCVVSSSKCKKTRFQLDLHPGPHCRSLRRSLRLLARLVRGHPSGPPRPIPFPSTSSASRSRLFGSQRIFSATPLHEIIIYHWLIAQNCFFWIWGLLRNMKRFTPKEDVKWKWSRKKCSFSVINWTRIDDQESIRCIGSTVYFMVHLWCIQFNFTFDWNQNKVTLVRPIIISVKNAAQGLISCNHKDTLESCPGRRLVQSSGLCRLSDHFL